MRPKFSTGYLTPQTSKSKRISKVKRTESNENLNTAKDLSDSFFQKLMSCPIKRQLVLTLINSEKDNIEEYKRNQANKEKTKEVRASPISKIKKQHQCESPTALLRRRALEQKHRQNEFENQGLNQSDSTSRSSSRQSNVSSGPSPIPFDKLLDGVVAYVEIKSKDQDRSSGAKALMRAMGAAIRETFTKDVTHVIFKDGSFTTYQKAKLMKIHLVSVLWIEAVRSNNMRVSEKKFPALGTETYNSNVSSMCSQMQKEYEGLIRDELHRSLTTGTPLPSTQALIDRRRTLMTPIPSSSNKFSQEFRSSQDIEVEKILKSRRKTYHYTCNESPAPTKISSELSDDDSDVGPFIDGTNIRRTNSSAFPNLLENNSNESESSNMDFTYLEKTRPSIDNQKSKRRLLENNSNEQENSDMDFTYLEKRRPSKDNRKHTRSNSSESSESTAELEGVVILNDLFCDATKDSCISSNLSESIYYKKTPKLKTKSTEKSSKSTEDEEYILNDTECNKSSKANLKTNARVSNQLQGSTELQILSKNICNTTNNVSTHNVPVNGFSNIAPNVTVDKSSSTNMSSLQISLNKEKSDSSKITEGVSTSTNMSALLISSDSNKDKCTDIETAQTNNKLSEIDLNKTSVEETASSKGKGSFSPIDPTVITEVLQILVSPLKDKNITKRRKRQSILKGRAYTKKKPVDPDLTESDDNMKSKKNLPLESSPAKEPKNNLSDILQNKSSNEFQKDDEILSRRKSIRIQNKSNKTVQLNTLSEEIEITPNLKSTEVNNNKTMTRKRISKKIINSDLSKQVEEKCNISDSSQDASANTGINKKLNKTRKLYNPDDSIKEMIINDESERESKRNEVKKRKSDEGVLLNCNIVTISPNILLTTAAKKFIDNNKINIKDILNKNTQETTNEENVSKKQKTKNNVNHISRSSDSDEQYQLAAEFTNKHNDNLSKKTTQESVTKEEIIKKRKSTRLTQNPRRKLNLDNSTSGSDEKDAPITKFVNRRSTMEFQTKQQMSSKKKLTIDVYKRPSIVCTKLHNDDVQIFNQVVRKLGGFVIENEVSSKTTHLVAGEPKRTINMLRAMAMGCWILKHEWLLRSLAEERWLPEEDYEATDFSPAVQQCRLQRQAFGSSYSMDIFQDCGPIYVGRGSIPRCSDLKELIRLCKGNVSTCSRNSAIAVAEYVRYEGVISVKETWILDSITFNKRMPLKKYIITATNSPIV